MQPDPLKLCELHQLPRPWAIQLLDLGNGLWKLTASGIAAEFTWDRLMVMLPMVLVASGNPDELKPDGDGGEEEYALTLAATLLAQHRMKRAQGLDFHYAIGTDEAWELAGS